MKSMLGFLFFMLFLAAMAFAMLKGLKAPEQKIPALGLTDVSWRAVTVAGTRVPEDSGLTVTFEEGGNLTGHGGCNGFFGTVEQVEAGIAIGPLGTTRMACEGDVMKRESAFLDALQKAKSFQIDEEGLHLLGEDGSVSIVLVADTT